MNRCGHRAKGNMASVATVMGPFRRDGEPGEQGLDVREIFQLALPPLFGKTTIGWTVSRALPTQPPSFLLQSCRLVLSYYPSGSSPFPSGEGYSWPSSFLLLYYTQCVSSSCGPYYLLQLSCDSWYAAIFPMCVCYPNFFPYHSGIVLLFLGSPYSTSPFR
jgi:hypothetical protein